MPNVPFEPASASNFADQFNPLFYTLLALSVLFGGGVFAGLIYLAVRYREGSSAPRPRPLEATPVLEAFLIGIPTVLGLIIFVWGARLYSAERSIPPNATEIFVMGKQWMWQIYHQDGVREMDRLTIPVGRPVRLTMVSQDVIHSFYIPAFRVQYYVLPGRYTSEWFTPTRIGSFHLMCNQYCGMDHSRMVGVVTVLSQPGYSKWLAEQHGREGSNLLTVVERGKALFAEKQCSLCHGAKDSLRGPTLVSLFGRQRFLADGRSITADADYIRNAITNPDQYRLKGESQTMPSFSYLGQQDVWALTKYVESQ